MSTSTINNNIVRVKKEISDIDKKIAQESKKEAQLNKTILQLNNSITRSTSDSSYRSKLSQINRKESEIARIHSKKAALSKKQTEKFAKLNRCEQALQKEREREIKKADNAEKKQHKERLERQRQLGRAIQKNSQLATSSRNELPATSPTEYDIFIAHASEDKDDFVRPLAEELESKGINVWYDEFILKVGDQLSSSIASGLARSKYGTAVLSTSFFTNAWPQHELSGMIAKEVARNHKMILPIWHKISKDEVLEHSPPLADKLALHSSLLSVEEIAEELIKVIRDSKTS